MDRNNPFIDPPGNFFLFFSFINKVIDGNIIQSFYPWIDELNIHLSFYLDGLSLLFTLLIIGIGFLVFVYSNGYMKGEKLTGRYYSYMLLFMGSMLGLVTSGNLISLYIFWELTSVTSFLLINLHHHTEKSRAAGLQALLITNFGGLAILSGFILIGNITGSFELSELLKNGDAISSHPLYLPVIILILLGAFTKSAQFPFHFWLPSAMAAPTPVSAYLHSAAMVNAGIYLIARMSPVLGNTVVWQTIIIIFGVVTMFTGAYFSLTQKDMKRILAYATISAQGILVLLLGVGSVLSVKAALLYLVVHAFYKATLFMVTGAIDKKTGTRNIYELGNLWKKMPVTMVCSVLALASMASVPPMMGCISKKLIFEAKVEFLDKSPYLLVLGFIAFIFLFAVSVLITYQVFFRKQSLIKNNTTEAGFMFLLGPVILSVLGFVITIFPEQFETFIEFAAGAVKTTNFQVDLKLWSGLTDVFWLSFISMFLGTLLFAYRNKIFSFFQRLNNYLFYLELSNIFLLFIDWLLKFTKKVTGTIQHGYHRFYLMIVFLVSGIFLWLFFIMNDVWDFGNSPTPVSVPVMGIVLIAIIATFITIITRSKITAIITMGVVGYSLGIFFLINGAVDLAITFIIIDTLTLALFVMVTLKLPEFVRFSNTPTRIRDGIVALAVGACMFLVALVASLPGASGKLADFYLDKSLPEGFGKNVVNVILVDFRALDTLGEITVVLIAAVSIFALLKLKPLKK
jgi:multicomponent Na+:H+ antiporter subunit A